MGSQVEEAVVCSNVSQSRGWTEELWVVCCWWADVNTAGACPGLDHWAMHRLDHRLRHPAGHWRCARLGCQWRRERILGASLQLWRTMGGVCPMLPVSH